jgi:hypothetical protein
MTSSTEHWGAGGTLSGDSKEVPIFGTAPPPGEPSPPEPPPLPGEQPPPPFPQYPSENREVYVLPPVPVKGLYTPAHVCVESHAKIIFLKIIFVSRTFARRQHAQQQSVGIQVGAGSRELKCERGSVGQSGGAFRYLLRLF